MFKFKMFRSPNYVECSSKCSCCPCLAPILAPDVVDFISKLFIFYLLPIGNVCVQVEPWWWPSGKQGSWGRGQAKGERGEQFNLSLLFGILGREQDKGKRGEHFDFVEVLGFGGFLADKNVNNNNIAQSSYDEHIC